MNKGGIGVNKRCWESLTFEQRILIRSFGAGSEGSRLTAGPQRGCGASGTHPTGPGSLNGAALTKLAIPAVSTRCAPVRQ